MHDAALDFLVGKPVLPRVREAQRGRGGDVAGAHVRGHDDDGVAEVHGAALGVGKTALLQNLQQDVEHIRMRLLDLVEEHHRVRALAHGLGELAALVEAHVARRRTHQAAHRVLLHVLGHVEGQKRVLGVEQELGQRLGKLGLAHARRAQEDERTSGALRILQARAGAADGLGKRRDGLVLADDALVQNAFHAQQLFGLGLGEVAHGHASGHGHHVGDILNRDVLHGLRRVLLPLLLGLFALLLQGLFLVAQLGGALELLLADGAILVGAHLPQLLVQIAQLLGQRHVADAHAGAGLVHDVDGLVGQVAILDVAVGQLHGGGQRLVGEVHTVVRLVLVAQALHDAHGLLLVGLVDGERLETALQRGVLLQVLAELLQGGGADDLNLAAGQRGL